MKNVKEDSRVIKLANTLKKIGFDNDISDGLITEDDFLVPCIVLAPKGQPKIRFNNEKEFTKKFLNDEKIKDVENMGKETYLKYYSLLQKFGETSAYKSWKKESKKTIVNIEKKISKFNKITKEKDGGLNLSLTYFDGGEVRLDFGGDKIEANRKKIAKLSLDKKKVIREKMLNYFTGFDEFLKTK